MQLPKSNQIPGNQLSGLAVGINSIIVTYRYKTFAHQQPHYYTKSFTDIGSALSFITNELKANSDNDNLTEN